MVRRNTRTECTFLAAALLALVSGCGDGLLVGAQEETGDEASTFRWLPDPERPGCVCHPKVPERCKCSLPDAGPASADTRPASPGAEVGPSSADGGPPAADTRQPSADTKPPGATCGDGVCNGAETSSSCPADCAGASYPPALWHGDPDTNGLSAWKGLQAFVDPAEPRLSVAADPTGEHGKVYQAMLKDGDLWTDGKARCEFYGSVLPDGTYFKYLEGDDLYFGWRTRINAGIAAPGGNGGNLTQFKGNSSCGGPAVGLTFYDGKVTLRTELYGVMWYGPAVSTFAGAWHDIVVHIKFSKSASLGFVELWLDGVLQTFKDGTTKYKVATMCPDDSYVYLKMGIYRSTTIKGTAYHWIESPRIGSSYQSVVPR